MRSADHHRSVDRRHQRGGIGRGGRLGPVATLDALWARFMIDAPHPPVPLGDAVARAASAFGAPGFYRPRSDLFNIAGWTSVYDTTARRAAGEFAARRVLAESPPLDTDSAAAPEAGPELAVWSGGR
ncbi:hypothetical protein P7L78_18955 [Tistrella bauzanensis]|uniref:hypothetical protein n=1 Tax=Tistrella TaxID=171436 RepID=UPI0031F6DBE4